MQLCGDDVSTLLVAPPLNPAFDELQGLEVGIRSSRLEEMGTTLFSPQMNADGHRSDDGISQTDLYLR